MSNASGLYRMFYLSRATREMTRGELEDLLHGARARNAERDVTGLLLYDRGNFAQVLEGPRETVERLFKSISKDPRHSHVSVVSEWPVEQRDFLGWTMGYSNIEEHKEPDLAKIKEMMRSQRVKDAGVAYRFLLAFLNSL